MSALLKTPVAGLTACLDNPGGLFTPTFFACLQRPFPNKDVFRCSQDYKVTVFFLRGHHWTYYTSAFWPHKIHIHPECVFLAQRDSSHSSINSRSPNLIFTSSVQSLRAYFLNHRNQLWVRLLSMMHSEEKFLSNCRSMKLENTLFASKIQVWDRIGILSSKGRYIRRHRDITGLQNIGNPVRKSHLVSRSGNTSLQVKALLSWARVGLTLWGGSPRQLSSS